MLLTALSILASTALAVDHSALAPILATHAQQSGVNYTALAADRAPISAYLDSLAHAELAEATKPEQMAFWVNAYNAMTLDVMAEEWPLQSIQQIDAGEVWKTRTRVLAGKNRTLDAIEHTQLRPMGDARIHAAIVCAAKGCPPLLPTVYTAADLEAQLDAAARTWVATTAATLNRKKKHISLSRIFEWFGGDFTADYSTYDIPNVEGTREAALNFVATYASPKERIWIRSGDYTVAWAEYDWSVNGQ